MTSTVTAPGPTTSVLAAGHMPVRRQLPLLLQWQARRMASALPLLVLVQILLSVATVIGYGLLVGQPAPGEALFLATGAPTVSLVMVGLVMTPQLVVQSRAEGSADWMRTLPVRRELFLAADLLVWTLIALPGVVLGVLAGVLRFHVHLAPTLWLVPTALVVSLTAAAVGYAIAWLLPGRSPSSSPRCWCSWCSSSRPSASRRTGCRCGCSTRTSGCPSNPWHRRSAPDSPRPRSACPDDRSRCWARGACSAWRVPRGRCDAVPDGTVTTAAAARRSVSARRRLLSARPARPRGRR